MTKRNQPLSLEEITPGLVIDAYGPNGKRLTGTVTGVSQTAKTVRIDVSTWHGPGPKDRNKQIFTAMELGLLKSRSGVKRRYVMICNNQP